MLGNPSLCFHPYTTPRLNAACFGAMSVSVLGDSYTVLPPPPRLNNAYLSAMGADVPLLLCYTP